MIRPLLLLLLALTPVLGSGCAGCTYQPTNGSQAVTFTPGQGLAPADGPGYMNGVPQDLRGDH